MKKIGKRRKLVTEEKEDCYLLVGNEELQTLEIYIKRIR